MSRGVIIEANENGQWETDQNGNPFQVSLFGNIVPDIANAPVLIDTIPYTSFTINTTLYKFYYSKLHRNAKRRTVWLKNTMDQDCPSTFIGMLDSSIDQTNENPAIDGGGSSVGSTPHPKVSSINSVNHSQVSACGDSLWLGLAMGATAPTTGNVYVYIEEVF